MQFVGTALAVSIGDAAWSELLRQPAYKASWYGRTFWQAPRTFASSKTCSDCGFKLKTLALSTRSWVCPDCGSVHDRDKNAARNILAAVVNCAAGTKSPHLQTAPVIPSWKDAPH